jgi:sugar phosphate isomerase/epimerase
MLFGTSTSVLRNKRDLDAMLALEPEVIEFYNYPSSALQRIEEFCRSNDLAIALHTPTPYDSLEPLRRFAPTGPHRDEASAALQMALNTVRCASRLGAIHVVVHFPSPYPDCAEPITDAAVDAFLDPLMNEAERLRVSVLVENVSGHPTFYSPEHYLELSDRYEHLEFCLDFGHAADVSDCGLSAFVRILGHRIRSCHVYNRKRGAPRGHIPVHPAQSSAEGWMDIPQAVAALTSGGAVRTWILEPDPVAESDWCVFQEGAMWFRALIRQTPSDPSRVSSDFGVISGNI